MKLLKTQKRFLCASILAALASSSANALDFQDLDINAFDINGSAVFARINSSDAYVIGVLDGTTPQLFDEYLQENPDTTRIIIGQVPGSADDASTRNLLNTIIHRGIDTHLEGFAFSGGVDLWLAGRLRTKEDFAAAGVHTWAIRASEQDLQGAVNAGAISQEIYDAFINAPRNPDGSITIPGTFFPRDNPQHREYIEVLEASGVPEAEAYYFFTLAAASADNIHIMTDEEINRWALIRSQLFTNVDPQIMADDLKAALSEIQGAGIGGVIQSFYGNNSTQLRQSVRQVSPVTSSVANVSFGNMRSLQHTIERQLTARRMANLDTGSAGQVWVDGSHSRLDRDPAGMESGFDGHSDRFSVGYDLATEQLGLFGLSLTNSRSSLNYNQNGGNSTLTEKSLSLYHSMAMDDHWHTESSLSYGDINGDSTRRIASLTGSQNANADIDGHSYSASINLGYALDFGALNIIPKLGVSYSKVSIDGYRENGNLLAASINSVDFNSATTKLGLTANYQNTLWVPGTLSVYAFWQHDFGNTERNYTARFVEGNRSFRVRGADADKNSAYAGISYEANLSDSTSMNLSANHEQVGDFKNTTYSLGVRHSF